MFEDKTFKRCGCSGPLYDQKGAPVLDVDGKHKIGRLNSKCPDLQDRGHGSWSFQIELEADGGGERQRVRLGGYRTQEDAANKAEEVYHAARAGVTVLSNETASEFLARWIKAKRTELKRTTAHEYERDIELYLNPHLGTIKMRDLRLRHCQAIFNWIIEDNERRVEHRSKVEKLKEASETAAAAWRAAPARTTVQKAERSRLRGIWTTARNEYLAERKKLQRVTGPGTMLSIKTTLSSALSSAVKEELIAKNYASLLTLPRYTKPRALTWTPQRVARWKRTGQKPSPVMVWTLEQTAQFLDFILEDRLFAAWHLVIFHGLRRGELAALTWDEIDLKEELIHITEQLVLVSYEVHQDDPKVDSVRDIKLNRDSAMLLKAWRKKKRSERAAWELHNAWKDSDGRAFTREDGEVYHPAHFTDRWERLVALSGLPPVRLHDGRHEAASLALAAGVAPKAVQAMLGHGSLRMTTDTYQTVLPEMHAASASASLDLLATYRKKSAVKPTTEKRKSGKKKAKKAKKARP
ncbi:site-specific integrase [Streptomyces sp. NPDC091278]|uniref:site-specific integrase n=1 Tax=Streptomyces sp. NPDC091278 TaxID=3155301 RepID=UPI00344EC7D0